MIISIRRFLEGVKLILVFVVCTLVFYGVVSFFSQVITPSDPFQKPIGKAQKVTNLYGQMEEEQQSEWETFRNRLMFFYWFGE